MPACIFISIYLSYHTHTHTHVHMYTFHTLMCICSLGLFSFQTCQPDELLIANNRWAGSHTTGKQAWPKRGQGGKRRAGGMASKPAAHCAISMRTKHTSLCNCLLQLQPPTTCSMPPSGPQGVCYPLKMAAPPPTYLGMYAHTHAHTYAHTYTCMWLCLAALPRPTSGVSSDYLPA